MSMPNEMLTVAVVVAAFVLAVGFMAVLRRQVQRRSAPDSAAVRVFGAYSPVLSWVKKVASRLAAARVRPAVGLQAEATPVPDQVPAAPRAQVDLVVETKAEVVAPPGENSGLQPLWGLVLAVVLAAFGQWTLMAQDSKDLQVGVGSYVAAIAIFAWAAFRLETPAAEAAFEPAVPDRRPPLFILLATSLGLCAWTAANVNAPEISPALQWGLIIVWCLSIAAFSWSVLVNSGWRWPARAALAGWWRTYRWEVLLVTVLALAALWLRAYNLEMDPYAIANDEGEHGKDSLSLLRGQVVNIFSLGYGSQSRVSFLPHVVSIALLGNTVFALRLVSAVTGVLNVICLYLLARELFGPLSAFLSALLLLSLPWHIHFSRLGVTSIVMPFYATLTLWLTYRALRRGRWSDYLWLGIATGLTLYTYVGARVIPLLPVGTLGYVGLRQRSYLRKHLRHLAIFAVVLVMMIAPIVVWYRAHPSDFVAQFNGHAILNNGWFAAEVASGRSPADVLLRQFSSTSLAYIASSVTGGFFYSSPKPYLPPVAAIFFMLGVGYAVWRIKEPRYVTLLAWLFGALASGTLTDVPPASERLILNSPAVVLLLVVGLTKTLELLRSARLTPAWAGRVLAIGLAAVFSVQGVNFYFGEYLARHYYENQTNELCYEVSQEAAALGSDYRMYLTGAGVPEVFAVFADFAYIAPEAQVQDFNTVTPETVAALPREHGIFFVAVPSRRADLNLIEQLVPGGSRQEVRRRNYPDEILYLAYVVSPSVLASR